MIWGYHYFRKHPNLLFRMSQHIKKTFNYWKHCLDSRNTCCRLSSEGTQASLRASTRRTSKVLGLVGNLDYTNIHVYICHPIFDVAPCIHAQEIFRRGFMSFPILGTWTCPWIAPLELGFYLLILPLGCYPVPLASCAGAIGCCCGLLGGLLTGSRWLRTVLLTGLRYLIWTWGQFSATGDYCRPGAAIGAISEG